MLEKFFISSSFLVICLFAACPNYPYTPETGVIELWEFFCDNWILAQPGNGSFSFNATGNGIYLGLFDNQTNIGCKYILEIGGGSNSEILLLSGADINTQISFSSFTIPYTAMTNLWTVEFDEYQKSISVLYEGTVVFSYVDINYLNLASNAQYISFGQSDNNVVLYQDCPTYPYTPRSGVNSGGYWEYFCPDWYLANPGDGSISFYATGNDLYVGLLDTWGSVVTKYHLLIASYGNAYIALLKNDDWPGGVSSTLILHAEPFSVPNTSAIYAYTIAFTKSTNTIAVYFNQNLVFSYVDVNYTNQVGSAQYISFSQWQNYDIIYAIKKAINNCSSYAVDALCQSCITSTYLTIGKLACANEIQNCTSYSDDTKCLSCNTSTYLSVSKLACVAQLNNCANYSGDGATCLSCDSNYFLLNNVCYQCDSSCLTCEGSVTNCTSCTTNYFLENNVCLGECSIGYFTAIFSNICNICDSSCLTCEGSVTNCTSCTTNYFLENNVCQGECSIGYFTAFFSNICNICDSSCLTCEGSATNCTSCTANYFLENNACLGECSIGYFTAIFSNICNICDSSCLTCEGSVTNCTSCTANYFLENNACVGECSIGYYFLVGSNICLNCDVSCLTCENTSTNCISCANGTFLKGNQCYEVNYSQSSSLINNVSSNLYIDFTESQAFLLVFQNYTNGFLENFESNPSNSFQLNITQLSSTDYSYKFSKVSQGIYRFAFIYMKSISDSNVLCIYFNSSLLSIPDINLINSSLSIALTSNVTLTYITAKFEKTTDPLILPFTFSSSFPELFSMIGNVSVVSISNFPTNNFNFSIKNTSNPLTFNLLLLFNVSLIGVHILNLTFDLPPEIFDINIKQLQTKTLQTPLINYCILNNDEQASLADTKESLSIISGPSISSMNIFAFMHCGSSLLYSAIILMNFLAYLKFLNINYPPNALAIMDADFRLFNFDIFPSFAINHNDNPVDLKFAYYNTDNYVLNNLWRSLLEKLLFIGIAFSMNFFSGKFDKIFRNCKLLNWSFNTIYKIMCWNYLLNSMITSLNDNFFFSLVNFAFPTIDQTGSLNLMLGSFIFFFSLLFVIFLNLKTLNIRRLLLLNHPLEKKQQKIDDTFDSPTFEIDRSISRLERSQRNRIPMKTKISTEISPFHTSPYKLKPLKTRTKVFPEALENSSTWEKSELNIKEINQNSEKNEALMQKFEILHRDFKQDSKFISTYFILDLLKFPLLSMIIILDRYNPFRQSILIFNICIVMVLFLLIVKPYKSNYLFMINIINQICLLFCTGSAFVLAYYDHIDMNDLERRFFVGKIFVFGTLGLVYSIFIIFTGCSAISVIRNIKLSFNYLKRKSKKNAVFPITSNRDNLTRKA